MRGYILLFFLLVCSNMLIMAQLSMPRVFSNHMVLQRNADIPVWGTATIGAEVAVDFKNTRIIAKADNLGNWKVNLPALEAGGPFELIVSEVNNPSSKLNFNDVMIGDVWLASGQSNMEWEVQQADDAEIEIPKANFKNIRFFFVPHEKSLKPETDIKSGSWKVCDSNSVKTSSAVAYYFSRELHADLNVPIGILQATWGGTPIEAWTSKEMLLSSPLTRQEVLKNDTLTDYHLIKDSLDLIQFWDIVYNVKNDLDTIVPQNTYDDSDWGVLNMPRIFKDWGMPFYEGMVWLRKAIFIPIAMEGKDLTLNLGHPEMNYSVYFNGNEICKNIWNANPTHSYSIPSKLLIKGENIIAVRMAVLWTGGGFNPPANQMYLIDGDSKISLAGDWKYKKDLEPQIPKIYNYHYYPTYVFNAMLHPILPYGLKGVIWYQGEANELEAFNYRRLFPMLISDWRIRFEQGYLPFIYVQLPNYRKSQALPAESEWAELRESQTLTLLQPNTGMVCTIDLGNENKLHPLNKQDVGHRLALVAKKVAYGINCIASGPMYSSFTIEENTISISFTEIGSGLGLSNNESLNGFAIAGADKTFYWAKAQIKGDKVIVNSNKVTKPVAVRYNWADNPSGNLINSEGLPAIPFRTDNWKGITEK